MFHIHVPQRDIHNKINPITKRWGEKDGLIVFAATENPKKEQE